MFRTPSTSRAVGSSWPLQALWRAQVLLTIRWPSNPVGLRQRMAKRASSGQRQRRALVRVTKRQKRRWVVGPPPSTLRGVAQAPQRSAAGPRRRPPCCTWRAAPSLGKRIAPAHVSTARLGCCCRMACPACHLAWPALIKYDKTAIGSAGLDKLAIGLAGLDKRLDRAHKP